MEQGQQIGELARQLYPSGILVSKTTWAAAVSATVDLVADRSVATIFEAAFEVGPFVARADILHRLDRNTWHIVEVKSSFSNTSQIQALVADLAYTVMVLRRAGLNIRRASLLLLSRNYRHGQHPQRLFETVEQTEAVFECVAAFEKRPRRITGGNKGAVVETFADRMAAILLNDKHPPDGPHAPVLKAACRNCPFFEDRCLGADIDHTVLELPSLHPSKLARLAEAKIVDLFHMPEDLLNLNPIQHRVRNAAATGNHVVETNSLREALAAIEWPCHYLDFETVSTTLPLYKGHGCHRQVLTQFSIHHRYKALPGGSYTNGGNTAANASPLALHHSEYLAEPSRDCQRELAELLIQKLGDHGSILVYSSFEQTQVEALARTFRDLARPLRAIQSRVMDLLPIVRNHVYHPEFRGSFSIKTVAPALDPEVSYDGMAIADGDTAIAKFARMARGEITGDTAAAVRRQLLDYCRMDTLAMARLHEALYCLATTAPTTRRVAGRA